MRNFTIGLVSISFMLSACSARPERFDTDSADKADVILTPTDKGIAPLAPIPLRDGEIDITSLGSMGTTQAFKVGDVTVIHRVTPANQVVSARLYIMGGTANLNAQTQGIEKLALDVSVTGGTPNIPKDTFSSTLNSMGSEVFSFTDRDFSGYGLKSVAEHFPKTWDMMIEAIFDPAMPEEEVQLRKSQQLAEVASLLENPDSHVQFVASRLFFGDHPYGLLHLGTEETVKSFTREDLQSYQRSILRPERMLLVVVGNIQATEIIDRVKASIARIAPSGQELKTVAPFKSAKGVELVDRALPTNYVLGYFESPAPGSPSYPAAVVALEYLRDRLFEEVRTKRNLTYAVSAGLAENRSNYGYLYVTATDPQTTMGVIFDQVEEMKLMQIPKQELDQVINVFLTEHYMGLETNGGQASMLARAHINTGDWRTAEAYLAEIRAVTPEDVQNFATTYLKDFRFGVVGNKAALNPKTFSP